MHQTFRWQVLAPILMFVAWNMVSVKNLRIFLKPSLLIHLYLLSYVFLLTVSIDLTTGMGVGLLFSYCHVRETNERITEDFKGFSGNI